MSLTIYPAMGYDSFISLTDADSIISEFSVHYSSWSALTSSEQEVYLRIATDRIMNAVSFDSTNPNGYLDSLTYDVSTSCLPKACALMAIHDVVYSISSSINPNTGLITSERVGDIQVTYSHGNQNKQMYGIERSPFPESVVNCLQSYGAIIFKNGINQATLRRA